MHPLTPEQGTRHTASSTPDKEHHINTDKLHQIMESAGIPNTAVATDYTDAYVHGKGKKILAIYFPDDKSMKKFFQVAENILHLSECNQRFGRMRDAGSPDKLGVHKGGTVVFPDALN